MSAKDAAVLVGLLMVIANTATTTVLITLMVQRRAQIVILRASAASIGVALISLLAYLWLIELGWLRL